ncbi:MAG: DNA translocase FtsK, partial [bacterium]
SSIIAVTQGIGGGYLGYGIAHPLFAVSGLWASIIILLGLLVISLLVVFDASLEDLLGKVNVVGYWRSLRGDADKKSAPVVINRGDEEDEEEEPVEEEYEVETTYKLDNQKKKGLLAKAAIVVNEAISHEAEPTTVKTQGPKIEIPLDLLEGSKDKANSGDIEYRIERIKKTLQNFGIEVEMGEVNVGPTVTQYTLKPAEGVKLSQILALSNDLALALAAHPIRIEAPIPGRSLVGIEVPNEKTAVVKLKDLLTTNEFQSNHYSLPFALGKDVTGHTWVASIEKAPHLLIAGATGSGKSVCINTMILSLLYSKSPDELKFIMVDPKRVELTPYNDIPHLLTPVITDVDKTINALKWATGEMDSRYKLLEVAGKRNIEAYNGSVNMNKLPYIVIIIDELADLMTVAANEVESLIVRLAQMSRAVGIHLVLATQRPSVDVITGSIKANIPTRAAFAVASAIDSRTILDGPGAEKLLGMGDMLFLNAQLGKPKRLQGAFVSDSEIEQVISYLKKNVGKPNYLEVVTNKQGGSGSFKFTGQGDGDDLLEEAKQIVIQTQKASASYLQRRLRVGYARAARLLDLLEQEGVVGPGEGAKPREILVSGTSLDSELTSEETSAYNDTEDNTDEQPR